MRSIPLPVEPPSRQPGFTTSLDTFALWAAGIVMCISLIGLISLGIWFYLDHRPRPAPKIPLSKVYADMWNAQKKLPPEDQEWFDAVSNLAGIPAPKQTHSRDSAVSYLHPEPGEA